MEDFIGVKIHFATQFRRTMLGFDVLGRDLWKRSTNAGFVLLQWKKMKENGILVLSCLTGTTKGILVISYVYESISSATSLD